MSIVSYVRDMGAILSFNRLSSSYDRKDKIDSCWQYMALILLSPPKYMTRRFTTTECALYQEIKFRMIIQYF